MTPGEILSARIFQNPPWMRGAPCKGHTDLFYPTQHGVGASRQATAARDICATCPHRVKCLEFAIDNNELHGVWGGTTPQERRVIARNRRDMGWTTGRYRQAARGVA